MTTLCDVIDNCTECPRYGDDCDGDKMTDQWGTLVNKANVITELSALPSAEAVEGKWILVKGSNGKDYHKCSKCLHTQEITGVKNYCAVCGARMKER